MVELEDKQKAPGSVPEKGEAMTIAEKELNQVRRAGGASYFWITETQARAKRFDAWQKSGVLIRMKDHDADAYPWCVYVVAKGDA